MMTHSLSEMDRLIVSNLHKIRALPFDVIVHLPRSGTIPASIIATYLRKPLASLEEFCAGMVSTRKCDSTATKRALLVDDSIRSGVQIEAAIQRLKECGKDEGLVTLCIISVDVARNYQPTLILHHHTDCNYVYPWFMWKTKRVKDIAFDMDGVLCRDCTKDEDDEGKKYLNFLETADPKFLTDYPLGAIITSRLEKYRPQTEQWLAKHGVSYKTLIMGPWSSNDERRGNVEKWKAQKYIASRLGLYVESSDRSAQKIAQLSGKPVWSIERMERYGD